MHRGGRFFGIVLGALALAGGCDSAPPKPYSVRDGFLRDGDGRALILHGANVSGHDKFPPYIDFQQQPDIARMSAEWGMNGMRLVVTWAAIEPQQGVFDDGYIAKLEQWVTWAEQAGVLVVVDMHQDLYGEGFAGGDGAPAWTCDPARYAAFKPTTPWFFGNLDPNVEACVDGLYHDDAVTVPFLEAWAHLASKLALHPNVIGFDPLNEPGWGTEAMNGYEAATLAPFYERVVAAVRAVAPLWVAFTEPGASRNLGLPTGLPKPDYADVMYAPHSYDSQAEQGQAYNTADRATILSNAQALRAEADALGAGLWVGEYGGPSSLPGITDYIGDEWDALASVGAGATYWDYSESDGGYGLLNGDGTDKADILAIVTRPYPQRVAGDAISFAWDSSGHALTVAYKPDTSVHAPTLVAVPPRFQPVVSVTCGDCTYDLSPPGVRILTPPSGASATVVVTTQ